MTDSITQEELQRFLKERYPLKSITGHGLTHTRDDGELYVALHGINHIVRSLSRGTTNFGDNLHLRIKDGELLDNIGDEFTTTLGTLETNYYACWEQKPIEAVDKETLAHAIAGLHNVLAPDTDIAHYVQAVIRQTFNVLGLDERLLETRVETTRTTSPQHGK